MEARTILIGRLGVRQKFFGLFYLLILLALAAVGYIGYNSTADAYRARASALVQGYTSQVSKQIGGFLERTINDLDYFSTSRELLQHLYWQDLGESINARQWKIETQENWRKLMRFYDYMFKVRFLDMEGAELITIRRSPVNRSVRVLPEDELQRRNDVAYFSRSVRLPRGGRLFSELDLNEENGEIERPFVPVIRIAKPVYGANATQYGVVVLNLFAESLFDYVRQANREVADGDFMLLDAAGNFLYHPDERRSFAHLLEHSQGFFDQFPELREEMASSDRVTRFVAGHVVTFQRIYPQADNADNYWILVGTIAESRALADLIEFQWLFWVIVLLVLLLTFLVARALVNSFLQPLLFVTRQLRRLGAGESLEQGFRYAWDDELRQMLDSTEQLASNMETVTRQADLIAGGDFSRSIALSSKHDRLGMAINNMTAMLQRSRRDSDQQNWLKDGIGKLNEALSADMQPAELAGRAIGIVGHYLDAGRGVLFLWDDEREQLSMLGSYMYSDRQELGAVFRMGEGTIGQSALERSPIALNQVDQSVAPIRSGTASNRPLYTYTQPLLQEEQLLGVMELAAFAPFEDQQRRFIGEAARVIGSFMVSVLQRGRIAKLLEVAELSADEARQKSERLAEANRKMADQQQQLQQQTEELLQANTQMEEQQQQLQQQTEELLQANTQMEEQQQQLQQQASEMERQNADLLLSRDELKARAEELEQASRYKSEFLANMSHELRTPLNSIILLSKMLVMNQQSGLADEEKKQMQVIHQAGEELLRLINDILDLAKIEAGKMEVNAREIDMAELLEEFRNLFAGMASSRGLEFRIENRLSGTRPVSDPDKLSQVLRNLLSNAFKFTSSGHVALVVEASGDRQRPLRILVEDSGIGIPKDKQQQVFEAFQQVDGSVSRQYGGTGLGLSISQRFAELLGGRIELESSPGEGSRFALLLPLDCRQQAVDPALGAASPVASPSRGGAVAAGDSSKGAAPARAPRDDRQHLKSSDTVILVVDDDTRFAESVAQLNHRLGYKTLIAGSGEEALRMAATYRPGGILLDLGLPDMDGAAVLHRIKTNRELRRIPVYIISGRDCQDDLLQQGIVGYLQKPVNVDQLADVEAQVLQRASQGASLLMVLGDSLSVDDIAELVAGDRLEVIAARDEVSALEQLARAPALAVVDMNRDQDECLRICQRMKQADPLLPIILYGQRQLSAEEEAALTRYSDSIIVKTEQASQRILDNVQRFLEKEIANAPTGLALDEARAMRPGERDKLKGCRVLVVDDDPRNLFVITSALEQVGAEVETALNGVKALQLLRVRDNAIDLVFMDIMMPEMDGFAAIREIKGDDALRHIPVVALTAKALKSDMEKAVDAGADDFLSKPVDFEVLTNMAGVWCRHKP